MLIRWGGGDSPAIYLSDAFRFPSHCACVVGWPLEENSLYNPWAGISKSYIEAVSSNSASRTG